MQSIMLSCPSEYILGLKRFALLSAEFCSTYPIHCVLRGAQEHIDQLLARHPEERKSEAGRELTFDPGDGAHAAPGPLRISKRRCETFVAACIGAASCVSTAGCTSVQSVLVTSLYMQSSHQAACKFSFWSPSLGLQWHEGSQKWFADPLADALGEDDKC